MVRPRTAFALAALLMWPQFAAPARAQAVGDRYGPPAQSQVGGGDDAASPRLLNWPGKGAASAPIEASVVDHQAAAYVAIAASPPAPAATARSAASTTPPALPTSLYTPAPPVNGDAPRRYSVDREYGVQPDPIPLPPHFFADSPQADLAEPPPVPPRQVKNTAGAVQARNDAADSAQTTDASSSPDSLGSN